MDEMTNGDVLRRAVLSEFPAGNVVLTDPHQWPEPIDPGVDFQLGWWAALRMVVETGFPALNEFEHSIASKVADLAADFIQLVGETETAQEDFAEILPHLHALQQTVMAQAAARAHPGRYRALGQDVDRDLDDTDDGSLHR
jgi:hypothetical protein